MGYWTLAAFVLINCMSLTTSCWHLNSLDESQYVLVLPVGVANSGDEY